MGGGLLARAGALLAPVLPQRRAVVVSDETVAPLHLPALSAGLAEAGFEVRTLSVRPGEASKSLTSYGRLTDALLEAGVERRTAVVALGGGVVGDLVGFAAATVLRGLPFVQVPTTLLAQVDSSVGGKTGVNTEYCKNLLVALLAGDAAARAAAVERACAFKARVVADDEREDRAEGGRALLNLGHTFGHALEAEYGYTGELLHGEAVSLGLVLAFRLSEKLGFCSGDDADRVCAHLAACGMPHALRGLGRRLSAASLIAHMQRDKKMRDGRLGFVLVRGVGEAFTSRDVPQAAVASVLRDAGCGE